MEAKVVEVIRCVSEMGTGKDGDPYRTIVFYWSKNGKLIASMDINDDPYSPLHPS